MEVKRITPSRPTPTNASPTTAGVARFLLDLREGVHEPLRTRLLESRLERFIGVIYRPETERWSHYSACILPQQFDAWVWFDHTTAVIARCRPACARARRRPIRSVCEGGPRRNAA